MLGRLMDTVLKFTMVPGFSRLGPVVRRRVHGWSEEKPDLTSRVAVVTGGGTGAGRVVATRLAGMGAQTWVTDTSPDRAARVASEIASEIGGATVVGRGVDISEFDAVRGLSDEIHAETDRVDIVVHNAGARHDRWTTSSVGVEATLATHLLGPYILTRRLEDRFRPGARILFMSNGGMFVREFDLAGLEIPARSYKGGVAYARANSAQVVLARRLADDYRGRFIVHAMHPGWTPSTHISGPENGLTRVFAPILRTPEQAADTMVWLATAGDATNSSGDFWHDRARRRPTFIPGSRGDPRDESDLIPWIEARIRKAER